MQMRKGQHSIWKRCSRFDCNKKYHVTEEIRLKYFFLVFFAGAEGVSEERGGTSDFSASGSLINLI